MPQRRWNQRKSSKTPPVPPVPCRRQLNYVALPCIHATGRSQHDGDSGYGSFWFVRRTEA